MDRDQDDRKDRIVSSWWEKLGDALAGLTIPIVLAISGGILWIIRTVFTDRQRVDALEKSNEAMKTDMVNGMADLRDDIRQLTGHLLGRKE